MPFLSAFFLVAALAFAVVIGPQTRPWTWGPSMLCLGAAALSALPAFWRGERRQADFGTLALAALTAGWFAWRTWTSPVAELGQADLLLLAGTVAGFVAVRGISGHAGAERLFTWGVALLLLASVLVVGKQILDPAYTPVFRNRGVVFPSGYFAAYNEAANYLIASSAFVGAAAVFGRHATATRIVWALIAIAGLASVWFTRSRGGILGGAVALGIFAAVLLIFGKRRNAKWFGPAIIALPIILIGVAAFLLHGWREAQEIRNSNADVSLLFDNSIRLYMVGLALSCISMHPLAGGGSRSFSWECYQFWRTEEQGIGGARPELVHNELLQAASDYGLIGAGLLIGLLGTLAVGTLVRSIFEPRASPSDHCDAWRLGAFAALGGMLIQSCFSFVFHMMPGTLLLGICLGQLSRTRPRPAGASTMAASSLLSLVAVATALLLLPHGWTGTRVTHALWPTHFGKQAALSAESRLDTLGQAILLWPHSSFYQERAALFQTLAANPENSLGKPPEALLDLAVSDYRAASGLHPFEPSLAVNRANVLSQLSRDAEAEKAYAEAIHLQGGMEAGFRANYHLAAHLFRKGVALHGSQPEEAMSTLGAAAEAIEKAFQLIPPWAIPADGRTMRINIHESLGAALEQTGDREGALEAYKFAATIPTGTRAHYRAAVLTGKMAVEAWSQRRPAEAMTLFLEARKLVSQAGGQLPAGVTPSQAAEYTAYLDRTIAFLKGAKVQPAK